MGKTLHATEGTFKERMMFRKIHINVFLLIHSKAFELSNKKRFPSMNKTDETRNLYHITFINALSYILKQYQPKNTTNPNIIGQE